MLVLQGEKTQAGVLGHGGDSDAPVRAGLSDGGGDGVMGAGLGPIAGRASFAQQSIDQDARAAAAIAVHQNALFIRESFGNRIFNRTILKARIAGSKDNSLK